MKVKVLPPVPDSLSRLEEARKGVPLVPNDEESCCARLMRDADVPAQDTAKEWLTFMRGLGLVAVGDRGYHRTRTDPDLAEAFLEGVYGADTLLAIVEREGPVSEAAAFESFKQAIPEWEQSRYDDPGAVWSERVTRLLGWAALFGLVEQTDEGYVRA
ncbi:hypothetical protein [Natronomonas sp. EA1]|uniref:hypothetical protein n=1 Tax=Natronomonas sp. EA1 TaxID=3421655 RepID=UPI003EB9631F